MNWSKDFYSKLCRSYKSWNMGTAEGIQLPIGIQKYCSLRSCPTVLTDEHPNALVVIENSSVFISQLLCTLTEMYSPSLLQIDFFDLHMRTLPSFMAYYNPQVGKFTAANFQIAIRGFLHRCPLPHFDLFNESSVVSEYKPYFDILKARMLQSATDITKANARNIGQLINAVYSKYNAECKASWTDLANDVEWYTNNVTLKYGNIARKLVIVDCLDDLFREDLSIFNDLRYLMKNAGDCGYHFLVLAHSNVHGKMNIFAEVCDTIIESPAIDPKNNKRYILEELPKYEQRELWVSDPEEMISKWIYPDITYQEIHKHMHNIDARQRSCYRKRTSKSTNW